MADALTFGITGAQGFLGSELTRLLRARGHRVVPLSRSLPAGEDRFIPYALDDPPPAEALRGLDVLVHGAYDFRCRDAAEDRAKNVEGSIALLRRAGEAGIAHNVFLSSLSAFEGCKSQYGRGKLEVELEALRLGGIVLRLGLVYADSDGGLSGSLRKLVRALKVIPLPGFGGQRLHPLASADLVSSLLQIVAKTPHEGPIALGEPEPMTFRGILEELARREGRRPIFVPVPWRAMWLGLKGLEAVGLRPSFRSDSLLSLVNQDPAPDMGPARALGLRAGGFVGRKAPAPHFAGRAIGESVATPPIG